MNSYHYGWDKENKCLVVFSKMEYFRTWVNASNSRVLIVRSRVPEKMGKPEDWVKDHVREIVDQQIGCDDYEPMDNFLKNYKTKEPLDMSKVLGSNPFEKYWAGI